MKPMAFNLKDAKKIHGDDKSSTFQLKSGHQIKILHAPLSALHRKQIEQMPVHKYASGGSAEPYDYVTNDDPNAPGAPNSSQMPAQPSEVQQIQQEAAIAAPSVSNQDQPNPSIGSDIGNAVREGIQGSGQVLKSVFGPALGEAGDFVKSLAGTDAQADQSQNNLPSPDQNVPGAGQPVQMGQPSARAPGSDQPQPPASQNPNAGMPGGVSLGSMYSQAQKAINLQQVADQQNAKAQAQEEQNYQDAVTKEQQNYDAETQKTKANIMDTVADMQRGAINPNHYVENMSVPGKIASIFGMILGGAGAGAGRPNPGVEMLNNQITRDIDAQKANLGEQNNILGAFMDQYKNHAAAENLTRATLLANHAASLSKIAAQNQGNMAGVNAANAKVALEAKILPLIQSAYSYQLASRFQPGGQGEPQGTPAQGTEAQFQASQNYLNRINPTLAKQMSDAYIPGVGVAAREVAPDDREAMVSLAKYQPIIDKAIADQQALGGRPAITPQERANAQYDQNALTIAAPHIFNLTRMSEVDQGIYTKMIGKLGSTNFGGVLDHLQNMKSLIGSQRKAIESTYGVRPFADSPDARQQESAPQYRVGQVLKDRNGQAWQIVNAQGQMRKVRG